MKRLILFLSLTVVGFAQSHLVYLCSRESTPTCSTMSAPDVGSGFQFNAGVQVMGQGTFSNSAQGLVQIISTGGLYETLLLGNNTISNGIAAWELSHRQDTYFGNTLGAFVLQGDYDVASTHDHYIAPIILNPNGDVIL